MGQNGASGETLIFDPETFHRRVFELIDGAKEEILLSTYIFENDSFGAEVFERLCDKAHSGVQIRICVDGYGSMDWYHAVKKGPHFPNLQVRAYHPVPWPVRHFDQLWRFLYHFNFRNHQKLMLFDRRVAILGSRNIHVQALHWRETSIVVSQQDVTDLYKIFSFLWGRSRPGGLQDRVQQALKPPKYSSDRFFSNHRLDLRSRNNKIIRGRLAQACHRILITTPYFLPQANTLKLLCRKAGEGVQVQILLPFRTDVKISKWLAQSTYHPLLLAGAEIYEYENEILHAKTLIVDDWALVGSSNFNRRSSIRDLEVDYSPRTPQCIGALAAHFAEDKELSIRVQRAPRMTFVTRFLRYLVSQLFYSWF